MFEKILIANRGEIACRIIKTARQMGVRTVALYSDADRSALHVSMADQAVYIGAAPSRESYLNIDKVIEAAKSTGAQAIHPGYGFLSENVDFCRACKESGLVFIGPPVGAIEAMGSKSAAKNIMGEAQVPLVPGYHGDDQDPQTLRASAEEMGYPVLLKAAAGGGGKGMRQVWRADEFDAALAAAKREALNGFGNDTMLVEKYLTEPRHVEIQVFCDSHGNAVYLFERDCSLQRRHQKVIEEAPAPQMSETLRKQMGEAAVRAAKAINYEGAGTVEFLLDKDERFYFMEMNTRLQVEHPVTEMISGQDLVKWQLLVASGEMLPCAQQELQLKGHAFEARIYAEDPDNDFLPVTGKLHFLEPPATTAHVRVDTGVLQGDEVSVYYDPMIAKLIVWDEDRDRALQRLKQSLRDYRIGGMKTNLSFLYNLVNCQDFADAKLDTRFIEHHEQEIFQKNELEQSEPLLLTSLYILLKRERETLQKALHESDGFSPWNSAGAWRMNLCHEEALQLLSHTDSFTLSIKQREARTETTFEIALEGKTYQLQGQLHGSELRASIDGQQQKAAVAEYDDRYTVFTQIGAFEYQLYKNDFLADGQGDDGSALNAPMNGTIVALAVQPGEHVSKGSTLLIMEAMKMEHSLVAPADGTVESFYYSAGDLVDGGAQLLAFKPDAEGK